jgi:hypothetical protein
MWYLNLGIENSITISNIVPPGLIPENVPSSAMSVDLVSRLREI